MGRNISPGALRIRTRGRFSDLLAFMNRDNSVVIVAVNRSENLKPLVININDYSLNPVLPPESINTFVIKEITGSLNREHGPLLICVIFSDSIYVVVSTSCAFCY